MEGVPVMDKGAIKFGALLGEGAFGTVKLAQVDLDGGDTGAYERRQRTACMERDKGATQCSHVHVTLLTRSNTM